MNLLFIGDIIASPGRRMVADHLRELVASEGIHLTIANAENAAGGFGVTPLVAEELFAMGLDDCCARPTTRTAPPAGGSI